MNTLSYSLSRGQTEVLAPNYDNNENDLTNVIGLTAKWRLFDGNKSKNLKSFYLNKAKESKFNLINERNRIREEVEESYYILKSALKNIQTTKIYVIKQRRILNISKHRFNAGVTNQREVVNNQRDLKQSEVNYIDSISNYNNNYLQLLYKTGKSEINPCKDTMIKEPFKRISNKKPKSACNIQLLELERIGDNNINSIKSSKAIIKDTIKSENINNRTLLDTEVNKKLELNRKSNQDPSSKEQSSLSLNINTSD